LDFGRTDNVNPECKRATFDEAELVRRAKKGDSNAFLDLVKHWDRSVFRIARQITQNQIEAEEVLFRTFLKASVDLEHCPDDVKFHVWLSTIAVNEALTTLGGNDERRASINDAEDEQDDMVIGEVSPWQGNPHEPYTRDELTNVLDQAMQNLEPTYRAVFVLRDIEEMSTEHTAQALNLPMPVVRRKLLRARLQLRDELTRRFK
jgi:RNA polymerase sigma-70 factor (ECF subfamily)